MVMKLLVWQHLEVSALKVQHITNTTQMNIAQREFRLSELEIIKKCVCICVHVHMFAGTHKCA